MTTPSASNLKCDVEESKTNQVNQTDTRKMVPVYHRWRTEWVRKGDPVAFTPGCGLETSNTHLEELLPLKRYQEPVTWASVNVKSTGIPVQMLLDDEKEETPEKKNL